MKEMDSEHISRFLSLCRQNNTELHALIIHQHGHTVFAQAFKPYDMHIPHPVYSVTKSFVSIAMGFLVQEKHIDIDTPWLNFFPEYESIADPMFHEVTLRHLLTMTMGHDAETMVQPGDDWLANAAAKPFADKPGTAFFYNSTCSYLIGRLIEKETGMSLEEYLKPRLFAPLHFHAYTWDTDLNGHDIGGFGLHLCIEDMAAFGDCLLQNGRYEGRQIIPADWLRQAVSKQFDNSPWYPSGSEDGQGYGFYFWRCTHNAFRCSGLHGQIIFVQPENELVLAANSAAAGSQAILDNLFAAMDDQGSTEMPSFAVSFPRGSDTSIHQSDFAADYTALDNPYGYAGMTLHTDNNAVTLTIHKDHPIVIHAGTDWQKNPNVTSSFFSFYAAGIMHESDCADTAFARYTWISPTCLHIETRTWDASYALTFVFHFDAAYAVMDLSVKALLTIPAAVQIVFRKEKAPVR